MIVGFDKFYFGSDNDLLVKDNLVEWNKGNNKHLDLYHGKDFSSLKKYSNLFCDKDFNLIEEKHSKIVSELKIAKPKWKFILKKEKKCDINVYYGYFKFSIETRWYYIRYVWYEASIRKEQYRDVDT